MLASQGKFTEPVSGLMERVEVDGYWVKERPRALLSDDYGDPLVVVRIRCVLSGLIVGIGFSLGGETAEAYRMAMFCAAIRKSVFGRLIGLDICDDDWPSAGLAPCIIIDRGPAGAGDALGSPQARPPILTMAPSYEGQSKAVIEASHPREIHVKHRPSFLKSPLNAVQIAKRETLRVLHDNRRMDVSSRKTPEMADIRPNPVSVWKYFAARLRTHEYAMPFEEAVRQFLPKTRFRVREDGAYLLGQRYTSDALKETGTCDRVVAGGSFEIDGYILPLCVKQAWVVVDGRLVEVDAMLAIREDREQLAISVGELARIHELRSAQQQALLEERAALDAEFDKQVERELGLAGRPTEVCGRARKTEAGRRESAVIKSMGGSKK